MSNNKKYSVAVILLVIVVSAITLIVMGPDDGRSPTNEIASTRHSETNQTSFSEPKQTESITIAKRWQWQPNDRQKKPNNSSSNGANDDEQQTLPFTAQSVHDALQGVKVDENGDVILDHDALISLDEALERIYKRLDSDSLNELQSLIEGALPGKTGEQTAKLVGDYQGFLQAREQFNQVHEGLANAAPIQTIDSISKDQALYKELQDLRGLHLGDETSASLFKVSDANAEFMFESMKLGLDDSLSAEQLASRRTEIEKQLNDQLGENQN